ncbi:MAG: enoyl-CoA hydratase/isomerase family protein [Chitinophagaceae bacterium]|nr:enoyl-CoA hydratase/isomerase family protein [Chitinophagaceae bacterium]
MSVAAAAYVRSELHQGVKAIEFFHPQSNSLPGALLRELASAITHAGEDPDAKLIVLRSAGDGAFCAGASFDELTAIKTEAEGLQFFSGFALVINAMRNCPKLIIGRIQGKCVGGGVGLAASVDYAIATEAADIKLSELAVGIGPFVVGPAVERKIGTSAFSQLAIDASMWRNAEWARRKGLFAEVHPDATALDEAIRRLSGTLAHSSPQAMAEMKKVFWKGTEHWETLLFERAAISGRLVLSDFTKNAIAAFKAK